MALIGVIRTDHRRRATALGRAHYYSSQEQSAQIFRMRDCTLGWASRIVSAPVGSQE